VIWRWKLSTIIQGSIRCNRAAAALASAASREPPSNIPVHGPDQPDGTHSTRLGDPVGPPYSGAYSGTWSEWAPHGLLPASGHGGISDRHRLTPVPFVRSMPGLDHEVAFGVSALLTTPPDEFQLAVPARDTVRCRFRPSACRQCTPIPRTNHGQTI
jgi:hypothetical protein